MDRPVCDIHAGLAVSRSTPNPTLDRVLEVPACAHDKPAAKPSHSQSISAHDSGPYAAPGISELLRWDRSLGLVDLVLAHEVHACAGFA